MNGNRGQYTSSPLYNMKKQRPAQRPAAQPIQEGGGAPQEGRRYQWLSIVMSVALPVLFLVSLFVPNNGLRWFFLIAAAASVACMWTLGAFVQSARGTLTVIYTALAVVVGLALFMNSQTDATRAPTRAAQTAGGALSAQTGSSVSALLTSPDPSAVLPPTEAPQESVSAAQVQLTSFFTAWQGRNIPEMLKYCAPSWVNAQTSPEEKLYQMLYSAVPETQPEIERIEGSDGNTSRIVTMKVWFSEYSGRTYKRLQVVMVKVNDVWYVDPNSLGGVVIDEAAEAAAAQNRTTLTNINYTLAPATATPNPSSITVYYNEQGGKYYHAGPTCSAVNEQYWPLTAFSFDLINSADYSKLIPCTKCNPPERPTLR